MNFFLSLLFLIKFGSISCTTREEYMKLRDDVLKDEMSYLLGASLKLSPAEEEVNKILMSYKNKEFEEGLSSYVKHFPAADHFFRMKEAIENSNVYKIIEMMPKGTNLHYHLDSSIDVDYIVNNITKWPNLYFCYEDTNFILFRFFDKTSSTNCSSPRGWESVGDLRSGASGPDYIDRWLKECLSMWTQVPEVAYRDTNHVWTQFEKKINSMISIMRYSKAFSEGLYDALKQHYEDNVMYVELRSVLPKVYHLDQSSLTRKEVMELMIDCIEKFKKDYPDFWGAKIIFAPHRFHSKEDMKEIIDDAIRLKKEFSQYLVGFDLVGQEDKGTALIDYIDELLEARNAGIDFYFHAGETDWFGTKVDENLADAVLLKAKRLAHGFALFRHPIILKKVEEEKIAVEVCPISNQLLRYIEDVRVHPATTYFRNGFPVVVASDDPGIWGARPMSHDWYVAFMAIAGKRADIKTLKQLAINSIQYSGMSEKERDTAMSKWESSWKKFLQIVVKKVKPATKTTSSVVMRMMPKNPDTDDDMMAK